MLQPIASWTISYSSELWWSRAPAGSGKSRLTMLRSSQSGFACFMLSVFVGRISSPLLLLLLVLLSPVSKAAYALAKHGTTRKLASSSSDECVKAYPSILNLIPLVCHYRHHKTPYHSTKPLSIGPLLNAFSALLFVARLCRQCHWLEELLPPDDRSVSLTFPCSNLPSNVYLLWFPPTNCGFRRSYFLP